jgi:hypothetical protein
MRVVCTVIGQNKVVTWTVEVTRDGTSRCCYLLAYVNHTTVTVTTEGEHYQYILIGMARKFEGTAGKYTPVVTRSKA